MEARATWLDGDAVLIRFPWSRHLLAEFKAWVPPRYRIWVKDQQAWRVRHPHAEPAIEWLTRKYPLAPVDMLDGRTV